MTKIELPNFNKIFGACQEVIVERFSLYGNSWKGSTTAYYEDRILREVQEYRAASTPEEKGRKLINIINLAAMAYETRNNDVHKCEKCGSIYGKSEKNNDG